MKYEILNKGELDASVGFYQAYFYGNGERSLLLNHLETWPYTQIGLLQRFYFS